MARKNKAAANTLFNDVASESPDAVNLSVSQIFMHGRMQRKQTIEQVAQALCIRSVYIQALEDGDISRLPEPVYTLGFVRSYAQYLDIDAQYMVDRFKTEAMGINDKQAFIMPTPIPEKSTPKLGILFASTAIIIAAGTWWHYHSQSSQGSDVVGAFSTLVDQIDKATAPSAESSSAAAESDSSPETEASSATVASEPEAPSSPQPPASPKEPEAVEKVTKAVEKTPKVVEKVAEPVEKPAHTAAEEPAPTATAPATPESRITLAVDHKTWLEVRDAQNRVVLNKMMNPGDQYAVPNQPGLVFSTGNAGATQAIIDGQPVGVLGKLGNARRHVTLDPGKLTQLVIPMSQRTPDKPKSPKPAPKNYNPSATVQVMPSVVAPPVVTSEQQ